ncbi:MAG TPA: peroxiredoxin family protein [Gemmataceae bacterium]|nr:peroxiredoxin family protein [Gemmataceae bacterium]
MRRALFPLLALLIVLSAVDSNSSSGQEKGKSKPTTYQEKLQSLLDDYRKENNKYEDDLAGAKTEDEKTVIKKLKAQMANGFAEKFLAFAAEAPKTPPAADAMLWILRYADTYSGMEKVIDMIIKNQLHTPKLVPVLANLKPEVKGGDRLLRKVGESSTNVECKTVALLRLAENLQTQSEDAENKEEAAKLMKEAEARAKEVIKKYAAVNREYTKKAQDILDDIEKLSPGKKAPDISGEDLEGQPLKLSDFKGRIVVLVFWNSRNPSSVPLMSEAQALFERLKGKPVTILGINSEKPENSKDFLKSSGYTWRSWSDRGNHEISKSYHIREWAVNYVIDPKGIIRYRNVHDSKLDAAVDALLQEK